MEISLRILALMIDCSICFVLVPAITYGGLRVIAQSGLLALFLVPIWLALFFVWPFLYFGLFTAFWGKTPGKFLCRLYVTDLAGRRPGLWRGLCREALRILAVCSGIGAIISLIQLIYQRTTWYDQLCSTVVRYRPLIRLTKTQKNYRRLMKQS